MNNTEQQQQPSQQTDTTNNAPLTPNESEVSRNDIPAQAKPAIFTEDKPLAKKRFVLPVKSNSEIQKRSAEKELSIVNFLGSGEVWSSLFILTHVLKIEVHQTRVTLKRMVNKKLLKEETLPDKTKIYGITNTGIALVKDQTNSKSFQIGKTPQSTVAHHLLTQKVRLLSESIKATDWLPGKAIYKDKNYHLINIADASYIFQGMSCVLEVELFVKSHKRMKKILENYISDLTDTQYGKPLLDRVYYFTPHPELIKQLLDQYVPARLRNRFVVIQLNTNVYPYRSPKPIVGSIESKDGSNE
jgi:lipoprotein signal peptidase